jgi:hypothetical protein
MTEKVLLDQQAPRDGSFVLRASSCRFRVFASRERDRASRERRFHAIMENRKHINNMYNFCEVCGIENTSILHSERGV